MQQYFLTGNSSVHSLEEITAALKKVEKFCPFCQSVLEYYLKFKNDNYIHVVYYCNLCQKLLFEDTLEN